MAMEGRNFEPIGGQKSLLAAEAVIIPFPNSVLLLFVRDFAGLRAAAFPAAHDIADPQVSVFDPMKAGGVAGVHIRRNLVAELPDRLPIDVRLDDVVRPLVLLGEDRTVVDQ